MSKEHRLEVIRLAIEDLEIVVDRYDRNIRLWVGSAVLGLVALTAGIYLESVALIVVPSLILATAVPLAIWERFKFDHYETRRDYLGPVWAKKDVRRDLRHARSDYLKELAAP